MFLDEKSDAQRQLAASLILHRANYEALRTNYPVVLLGDFNSPAFGLDNAGYEIITGTRLPVEISQDFKDRYPVAANSASIMMIDFMGDAPRPNVSGNYGMHTFLQMYHLMIHDHGNAIATYTGFSKVDDTSSFARIDFIMGGSNRGWSVSLLPIIQWVYILNQLVALPV